MIRILVCGEGPHEVGTERWSERHRRWNQQEGWMQPIIRKCVANDIEFLTRTRKQLLLLPVDEKKHKARPTGHGAKALLAKLIALQAGVSAIVFMVDTDDTEVKRWNQINEEIRSGFLYLSEEMVSISCVPLTTSESWLLADKTAWQQIGLEDISILPKQPERLWGERQDPNGNHPHRVFARICAAGRVRDDAETRNQLAFHTEAAQLANACPTSFPAFFKALQEL